MALKGVAAAAKEYHEKKAQAESGSVLYFKLADGEEAQVRFLEEGDNFTTYHVHRLPQQGNYFPQIPCLNQHGSNEPCPGCEEGIKRSFKFAINLIWRNGPVYERDKDNKLVKGDDNKLKVIDHQDGVFVWTGGIQVAEDLDHLDGKYKGLRSRDFEISRSGTKLDTKYRFLPTEQSPLSENDKKLASQAYDLNQLKKPPSYESFFEGRQRSGGGGSSESGGESSGDSGGDRRQSPFRQRS